MAVTGFRYIAVADPYPGTTIFKFFTCVRAGYVNLFIS